MNAAVMFWNTNDRVEVLEYKTLGKYTATIILITVLVCCNITPEQMIQDDAGMVIVVL